MTLPSDSPSSAALFARLEQIEWELTTSRQRLDDARARLQDFADVLVRLAGRLQTDPDSLTHEELSAAGLAGSQLETELETYRKAQFEVNRFRVE